MEGAGIRSFKIEGRMKSGYYLASVINAYRRVLDGESSERLQNELLAVAHRAYTQAYFNGKNPDTVNYTDSQSKGEYTYIADVLSARNNEACVRMRNRFKVGDVLEVLSPSGYFGKSFVVERAVDSKGEETEDCKLVQETYTISCPYELQEGDYLRRKNAT